MELKTLGDLLDDKHFNTYLNKVINEVNASKQLAGINGKKLKRNWVDRINEAGNFNADFIKNNIGEILNKKSILSSELRGVVKYIFDVAAQQTFNHYKVVKAKEATEAPAPKEKKTKKKEVKNALKK